MKAFAVATELGGRYSVGGPTVAWDAQDLAGFESNGIAALATTYDMMVIDHPHLGAAVREGALLPLDQVMPEGELASWRNRFVGESLESYTYAGRVWCVPVDAAAQVSATRADLTDAPRTWSEALRLMRSEPSAVATVGPHTLLTFLGICAAIDARFDRRTPQLVPREVALAAIDLLAELVDVTPIEHREKNPIQILDAIANGQLSYSPLIFSYITYSDLRRDTPVRFADAPSFEEGGSPGSVLGGAGLAVSARRPRRAGIAALVDRAADPHFQLDVFAESFGQPAAREVWSNDEANARSMDFFRATLRTQESAWRRPRFAGWITFQREGSRILSDGLPAKMDRAILLDSLDAAFLASRQSGR